MRANQDQTNHSERTKEFTISMRIVTRVTVRRLFPSYLGLSKKLLHNIRNVGVVAHIDAGNNPYSYLFTHTIGHIYTNLVSFHR